VGALSRTRFFDLHPRPYVVFGDYDASKPKPMKPARLQLALKLIKAIGIRADCSGADDAKKGTVELWFSEEDDARRFADAVLAGVSSRKRGYGS
jgi:hypothetical protein